MSEASPEVQALAKRYVALTSNDNGELLANVYETEGFKALFDPNGANERKLRLPRKMMQVHNNYNANTHLF